MFQFYIEKPKNASAIVPAIIAEAGVQLASTALVAAGVTFLANRDTYMNDLEAIVHDRFKEGEVANYLRSEGFTELDVQKELNKYWAGKSPYRSGVKKAYLVPGAKGAIITSVVASIGSSLACNFIVDAINATKWPGATHIENGYDEIVIDSSNSSGPFDGGGHDYYDKSLINYLSDEELISGVIVEAQWNTTYYGQIDESDCLHNHVRNATVDLYEGDYYDGGWQQRGYDGNNDTTVRNVFEIKYVGADNDVQIRIYDFILEEFVYVTTKPSYYSPKNLYVRFDEGIDLVVRKVNSPVDPNYYDVNYDVTDIAKAQTASSFTNGRDSVILIPNDLNDLKDVWPEDIAKEYMINEPEVNILNVTDTSASILWDAQQVDEYELYVNYVLEYQGLNTSYNLTSLNPDTFYNVKVIYRYGDSIKEKEINFKTLSPGKQELPIISNVNVAPGADSALVTWNSVSEKVYIECAGIVNTVQNVSQYQIINLSPNMNYEVKIWQESDTAISPVVKFQFRTSQEQGQEPLPALQGINVVYDHNSAQLSWQAVSNEVHIKVNGVENVVQYQNTYNLNNLIPDRTYEVYLWQKNGEIESSQAKVIFHTLDEPAPSDLPALDVQVIPDVDYVTVKWNSTENEVHIFISETNQELVKTGVFTDVISSLQPDTTYNIKVWQQTATSISPKTSIAIRTLPAKQSKINIDPLKNVGFVFTNKFPFSLPWDLKRSIESITSTEELPLLNIGIFNPDGSGQPLQVEMQWSSMITDLAPIVRSGFLFIFVVSLIFATVKLFGGAT